LAAATKEIAVAVAEPIRCFGVDEAGRAFVSFAAVAEENALEVVLEDSIALAALAAEGNYFLYTVEEHLIDDWFVSSGVDLAFVDDAADVVAVLQHPMQPLERDGSFGEVACCACGESEVGHGGFQSFESVLAGGIQFEGLAHQRSTFGVDLNRIEIPFLVTDLETSELVKTSANAFLATKISFINAMAEVCEVTGADVSVLADAIGHDARIGRKFLNAGIAFGGGCLPNDIRAFMARAGELGAFDPQHSVPQAAADWTNTSTTKPITAKRGLVRDEEAIARVRSYEQFRLAPPSQPKRGSGCDR
jgi:hypothetical protein